jgi:hypothetical protein
MFTETKCLSFEELSLYAKGGLAAKEKHRIEEHLIDCELCSAAVSGYAAVPVTASDITDLHRKIDGMTRKKSWYTSKWFIGSTTLAAVIAVWYFAAKPLEKKQQAMNSAPVPDEQYVDDHKPVPPPSLAYETGVATDPQKPSPKENFIRRKVKEEKPAEQPAPVTNSAQPSNAAPVNPKPTVKPVVEAEEPIVEQKYNAPVRYLEDLKVTDFEKYYTRPVEPKRTNHNVPAYKENRDKKSPFDEVAETERTVGADEVLAKGLKSFNKKDWTAAMAQFNILLGVNSDDVNALFYKGVCAWNMDRPLIAQKCLMQVVAEENNVFHQEAQWYLALTYIKAGEEDQARDVLQQIVSEKGFYSKQAKEKLSSL